MAKCKNCKNLYMAITSDNEYICNWCEKIKDNPHEEIERECEYYEALTNADRIRSMTDEELADFLLKVNATYAEPCMTGENDCVWEDYPAHDKGCKDCFLEWLKTEAGCE